MNIPSDIRVAADRPPPLEHVTDTPDTTEQLDPVKLVDPLNIRCVIRVAADRPPRLEHVTDTHDTTPDPDPQRMRRRISSIRVVRRDASTD